MNTNTKILNVIWLAVMAGYVGLILIFAADLFVGGGMGTASVSLFISGLLNSIQWIINPFLEVRRQKITKITWCAITVAVLILGLLLIYSAPTSSKGNDADTVVFFCMMALSPPIGFLSSAAFAILGPHFQTLPLIVGMLLIWGTMSLLGALQWFYLWPRLVSLLIKR